MLRLCRRPASASGGLARCTGLFPCFTMFDIVQVLTMQQPCSGALQQSAAQQQETGWCRLAASKRQALTPMVLQVVPDSQRSEVPFRFVQFGSVNTRNGASLRRLQDGGGFAAGFPCCTAVAINPDPVCSPQACRYLAAHLISAVSTHDAALNHLPTNSTGPGRLIEARILRLGPSWACDQRSAIQIAETCNICINAWGGRS